MDRSKAKTERYGDLLNEFTVTVTETGEEILHGKATLRHVSGRKLEEGSYEVGKRVGVWQFWHSNGAKSAEGSFMDGEQHGTWRWWTADGSLEEEGNWRGGKQHGEWTYYRKDGRVLRSSWRDGVPWEGAFMINGTYYRYRNGTMVEERQESCETTVRRGRATAPPQPEAPRGSFGDARETF